MPVLNNDYGIPRITHNMLITNLMLTNKSYTRYVYMNKYRLFL